MALGMVTPKMASRILDHTSLTGQVWSRPHLSATRMGAQPPVSVEHLWFVLYCARGQRAFREISDMVLPLGVRSYSILGTYYVPGTVLGSQSSRPDRRIPPLMCYRTQV